MTSVKVHAYDLTGGMARQMSMQFLGKQMDAVYHTGIVAFGKEWWFGGGLSSATPGTTHFGSPLEIIDMGRTDVSEQAFMDWLKSVEPTRFSPQHYNLLTHNCNTFTDEAARFLVGKGIPEKITGMVKEVMDSPMGPMLLPMLENMSLQQQQAMGGHAPAMNGMGGMGGMGAAAAAPPAASTNPWAGMGAAAASAGAGVGMDDPDPELTMALKASMEEEQARLQSNANGAAASSSQDASMAAPQSQQSPQSDAAVAPPPSVSLSEAERERVEASLGPALQALKSNDDGTIGDLRKRLRTIALNLVDHPDQEKFRRFRLSNATVQKRLVTPAGSMDWLRGLGFQEKEEGGEPVLILEAGAADPALLRASTVLLAEGLQ